MTRLRRYLSARPLLVAGRVLAAAFAGLWMLLAARGLALDEFADLALLAAVSIITVQLADAGLTVRIPAAVAVHPGQERSLILLGLRKRAPLALGAAAVTVAGFLVAAQDPSWRVAGLFAVSVVATSLHALLAAALRAMERYRPETVIEPASRLLVLVVGAAALTTATPLPWIAAAYATADVVALVVYAAIVARATAGQANHGAGRLASGGLLAVSVPLGTVYWRADAWLLSMLSTGRQVARYGVAYRVLDAALLPAMAISSTLTGPVAQASPDQVRVQARRAIRQCTLSVLPCVLVAVGGGRWLLGTFFGERYESAWPVLAILGLAAIPSAVAVVLTTVLAVRDHRGYSAAVGSIVVVSLVANLIAIPAAGALGAAWTTLGTQVLFAGGMWARLQHVTAAAPSASGGTTPVPGTAGRRTPLVPT